MAPYKCPDCGTWWAGIEHRCQEPITATSTRDAIVIRHWQEPADISSTAPMFYCEACIGWHGPVCPRANATEIIA